MLQPIFLMGPTAIGKTDLAIALQQKYPIDIISVDSAMVYQGMNIGTGKPSKAELACAPHALVDIRSIEQTYSAADFVAHAHELIEKSLQAGRIPLLVGGTMMYFKVLQEGLSNLPSSTPESKDYWNKQWLASPEECYQKLKEVDSASAMRLPPGDKQRILRALEVYSLSNKPMSCLQNERKGAYKGPGVWISMVPKDREWLRKRIAKRFEKMLNEGFVEEVEALMAQPNFAIELPSMQAVGYKQVLRFLAKRYTFAEMKEKSVIATCQLAKRQLTWLRSWQNCQQLEWHENKTFEDFECFLSNYLV